ncbi:hypothetical protein VB712_13975 [Spirulina sp. CCNP1310]|uniref:hypothetical protein n=1 Tax=Spirulina sp. CCNP1310 TaxID=3110249 RepID=UPI002B20531B|nr:hypothetical protein [Spirulina sp. CCNP1310]MEA5420335.1 hypothetical protein [Spirulina sp. CCNP1310]
MELKELTLAYESLIEQIEEFDFEQAKCRVTWFEETVPGTDEIPSQGNLVMVFRGEPYTADLLKHFIEKIIYGNDNDHE